MPIDKAEKQYLIFLKYQREYLSKVTGYSKGYLSRIATGSRSPDEVFRGRCSHALEEPEEELFRLIEPCAARIPPLQPKGKNQDLIETIDELAGRLTDVERELKAVQDELNQYK